jgi:hypothetical protein
MHIFVPGDGGGGSSISGSWEANPVHRVDFKSRENTSLQKEARANAVHTGPKIISLSKKVYSFLL